MAEAENAAMAARVEVENVATEKGVMEAAPENAAEVARVVEGIAAAAERVLEYVIDTKALTRLRA